MCITSLKCKSGDTSPPSGSDSPASRDPAYKHAVVCSSLSVVVSGTCLGYHEVSCAALLEGFQRFCCVCTFRYSVTTASAALLSSEARVPRNCALSGSAGA